MTPEEQELARDLARLDRLTDDELAYETGAAELAAATGDETDHDRTYRAALEKRAR